MSDLRIKIQYHAVLFHVDEMTPMQIFDLSKVDCSLMIYSFHPHEQVQTVHGIMLWTGNSCEIPDINGHTHFTDYPETYEVLKNGCQNLANYYGSTISYHGDLVSSYGSSLSAGDILDNLFINK